MSVDISAEEIAGWTNAELALGLRAAGIGSGDRVSARICVEAAKRLTAHYTDGRGNREASNVDGSEGLKPNAPFSSVSSTEASPK